MAVAVIGVAAAVLLATGRSGGAGTPGSASTSTDPGSWVLPRLSGGGQLRLADLRGRPLVLNFFASWCTACRGETPGFLHVQSELHGTVTFAGVNTLESGDGAAFARELHIERWPLARDVGGSQASGLRDAFGGSGLPITAFYSKEGKLLHVALGAQSEDVLLSRIKSLFGLVPGS